jgi:hypothetical protein
MATQLLKFRLTTPTTSYVTGITPTEKSIIELNNEVDKGNEKISDLDKKISNLNIYIKLIEDKLSCFFDVDDDFIIEGN